MKNISKLIAIVLMLSAAPLSAETVGSLAAKVNNEPITMADYNKAKNIVLSQYSAIPGFMSQPGNIEKAEAMALEQMIDNTLLKQKAKAAKIKIYERELENRISEYRKQFSVSKDGKVLNAQQTEAAFRDELKKNGRTMEEFRKEINNELMVRKLVQDTLRPRIKVPADSEVKAFFDNVVSYSKTAKLPDGLSHEDENMVKIVSSKLKEAAAERVRLRHVYCSFDTGTEAAAKAKAEKAYKELSSGAIDFDDAVEKYSEDRDTLGRFGDMGYVIKGILGEEADKAIFSLPVGGNSKPVKTAHGWHIFRVEEKRAEQKIRYSAVREELSGFLSQKNYSDEYSKFMQELRKDAKIDYIGVSKK